MAVRQYVGARYVPKFYQNSQNPNSMVWEGNRSYEALTTVTYNNDSYTSKIPVPAGIGNPAQNPTYWALTGNYNAQIEQYRQDVQGVSSDLQTEVTNRENADAQINETITAVSNRVSGKIIMIGDSYADPTVSEGPCYQDVVKNGMGYTDDNFIATYRSGAGFLNDQFYDLLNNLTDDTGVTEIYVFGGWNDANDIAEVSSLPTKFINFITLAKQKFPNAKCYLGFLAGSYNATDKENFATVQYWYAQSGRSGLTYIAGSEHIAEFYMNALWKNPTGDRNGRAHPSALGETIIAAYVGTAIRNKSVHVYYTDSNPVVTSNYTFSTIGTITRNDNIVEINYIAPLNINGSISLRKDLVMGSDSTVLGEIANLCLCGNNLTFPCHGGYVENSTWHDADFLINIKDRTWSIVCLTNGSPSGTLNVTQITLYLNNMIFSHLT